MALWVSEFPSSVVVSPLSSLILLIWVFSLFPLVKLAKNLSILLIFSKNQLLFLLQLDYIFISPGLSSWTPTLSHDAKPHILPWLPQSLTFDFNCTFTNRFSWCQDPDALYSPSRLLTCYQVQLLVKCPAFAASGPQPPCNPEETPPRRFCRSDAGLSLLNHY